MYEMLLKVSKSQKHFLSKLHWPKTNAIFDNILPTFIGRNFVKYLVRFLGNGVLRKDAFEIY